MEINWVYQIQKLHEILVHDIPRKIPLNQTPNADISGIRENVLHGKLWI